MQPDLSHFRTE